MPKTAYDMRISDWSSDVCSSDLNLERTNTWFAQAKPWMDYLPRAQYMLRQGTYVADVLYFVGEDRHNQAEYFRPDVSPDPNPRLGRYFDPKVPAGSPYVLVTSAVLLNHPRLYDGGILLPPGPTPRNA